MLGRKGRVALLLAISVAGVLGLFFVGPIPQDPSYHRFADTREFAGIENFWNVVSNIPFLIVAAFGLRRYSSLDQRETRMGYFILCAAVALVGVGSAYYHHAPSNASLLWDRLPMTVAFMALFAMLLGERVLESRKLAWLWSLVTLGVAAALYWSWTESTGHGDLRPYAIVQFLPIVLMPLILVLFPASYLRSALLFGAIGWYFVAKALEYFDGQILELTGVMSGHALKHVAAAVAVLCIIVAVPASGIGGKHR